MNKTTISKTAAIRQARDESDMHKLGDGYVLKTWDDACKAWRESYARPYHQARADLLDWRTDRVCELIGIDAAIVSRDGSLESRFASR